LFGISKGFTFSLYPADTVDFFRVRPATTAIVEDVTDYDCQVKLIRPAPDGFKMAGARAIVADSIADARICIDLSKVRADPTYAPLAGEIVKGTLFVIAGPTHPADVKIVPPSKLASGGLSAWEVLDSSGTERATFDAQLDPKTVISRIRDWLRKLAQHKATIELRTDNPLVRLEMEFVRVPSSGLPTIEPLGRYADLGIRDQYAIRVRATPGPESTGDKVSVYLAILDCLPNGNVTILWPDDGRSSEATRIIADGAWNYVGRSLLVRTQDRSDWAPWEHGESDGMGLEVLKLFGTDVEVDYWPFVTDDPKANSRGPAPSASTQLSRILAAFGEGRPLSRGVSPGAEPSNFSVTQAIIHWHP
jgi:hypothetical protein